MNRYFPATCLIALALTSPAVAEMIAYSGTKSAVFTNPVGGMSNGAGTSQLDLGDLNHGSLHYYTSNPSFSTTEGSPFILGSVGLWNGHATNIPSQATFKETLNFGQPNLGPLNFNFNVAFSKSGDNISSAFAPGQTSTVTVGNTAYTLELLGLNSGCTWNGDNSSSTLTTPPCQNSASEIWGQLERAAVDPPPSVPEPSAIALGVLGLGTIAFRRWRKWVR